MSPFASVLGCIRPVYVRLCQTLNDQSVSQCHPDIEIKALLSKHPENETEKFGIHFCTSLANRHTNTHTHTHYNAYGKRRIHYQYGVAQRE